MLQGFTDKPDPEFAAVPEIAVGQIESRLLLRRQSADRPWREVADAWNRPTAASFSRPQRVPEGPGPLQTLPASGLEYGIRLTKGAAQALRDHRGARSGRTESAAGMERT